MQTQIKWPWVVIGTDAGGMDPDSATGADVVVFDETSIIDKATPEEPHQLSVGVKHVWVNGIQVLADGRHTGAKPGRAVRGSGWRGY